MVITHISSAIGIIGLDGVGKSAVAKTIVLMLEEKGLIAQYFYIPTEPFASLMKKIRVWGRYPSFLGYSLAVKFSSVRLQSALKSSDMIAVCDRWIGDTIASHLSQGVSPLIVRSTTELLNIPIPWSYNLLTCAREEREERMLRECRVLNESDQSHLKMDAQLCRLYLDHINRYNGVAIDTTFCSIENVSRSIVENPRA